MFHLGLTYQYSDVFSILPYPECYCITLQLADVNEMPEAMGSDKYDATSKFIMNAAQIVADKSMSQAANEIRGSTETADTSVSVDGTWQRKGFTSTNGVITAISVDTRKVLDVAILSKSCKASTSMLPVEKSDPQKYMLFGKLLTIAA